MHIRFSKMHGLGNDFMVVDWPADRPMPSRELVRRWADRRLGVGFDQLLIVTDGLPGENDARYRIFNADGGEVEQCGNGARCIARFVASRGGADQLVLGSAAGPIEARVRGAGVVSVNLGVPRFAPAALPFDVPAEQKTYHLSVAGREIELGAVSVGNPHAVILVDSSDAADVGILGPGLATHPAFPQGVNVGFLEIIEPGRVRLRVYERGVGETPACGTGAAAAVAVGRHWGKLDEEVEVELRGGRLSVHWPGPGESLWQTGPTTLVYEGLIEL
jgi:diaminopimelate epimerase